MIYTHLSSGLVALDRKVIYAQDNNHMKPRGLWFGVDGDWERWMYAEEFGLDHWVIPHRVTFHEEHICFLRTPEDLDVFSRNYHLTSRFRFMEGWVNWEQITKEYRGVVIAPYCWERRMEEHTFWYYGWDCASGCIWDLSAIDEFRPQLNIKTVVSLIWREIKYLPVVLPDLKELRWQLDQSRKEIQ